MSTALELKSKGWHHYIRTASLRHPSSELTPTQKEEKNQLLEKVRKVAENLKERFGARRVILFGSLAQSSKLMIDSDVDLAVEGLESSEYWDAWRAAEDLIYDRPIDLVEIETASTSLKNAIEQLGIEL